MHRAAASCALIRGPYIRTPSPSYCGIPLRSIRDLSFSPLLERTTLPPGAWVERMFIGHESTAHALRFILGLRSCWKVMRVAGVEKEYVSD